MQRCPVGAGLALGCAELTHRGRRGRVGVATWQIQPGVQRAGRRQDLRHEQLITGVAGVLEAERQVRVRADKLAEASEGDPAGDGRRRGGHPRQSGTKLRRHAAIVQREQVAQVRPDRPEHHLRAGEVLAVGEVGGERLQVGQQWPIHAVRTGHVDRGLRAGGGKPSTALLNSARRTGSVMVGRTGWMVESVPSTRSPGAHW